MDKPLDFIAAIASNMGELTHKPLADIKAVLEDGEALLHLGATDDDQGVVEEAHDIVCGWISAGYESYEQATEAQKPYVSLIPQGNDVQAFSSEQAARAFAATICGACQVTRGCGGEWYVEY